MHKKIQRAVLLSALLLFSTFAVVNAGDISPQLQSVMNTAAVEEEIAVIIQLNDQLDRKQFKKFKKKLRRLKLLKALKQKAAADQASLQSYLTGTGGKKMRHLWIINGMAVKAKPSVIRKLARRPEVREVRLDMVVPLVNNAVPASAATEWNITMVGADQLWAQGYQGQGVVIASMDSGIDYEHTELAGNWRGGTNSWFDPHGEHALPYDAIGHGTQTAGIMFGQNLGASAIGMAPAAQWIAVKIFADNGDALASDVHAGFQWLLDPDGDPNTDDAPDIVNNSWGFPDTVGTCDSEFANDIQMFRDLDISLVFSAGNLGSGVSDSSPANYPNVFAVGAVDQNQLITSFSSQGPSTCGQPTSFPAAVAPGYLISTSDLTFGGLFASATTLATGTSVAAPHVTGAMALLLSADPTLTPSDLETVIRQSSLDLGNVGDDNVYGSGLIDAAAAFNLIGQPPQCTDVDGDGYFVEATCGAPVDCNDADATVYPGATEVKHDGIDQDCNGYDLTIDILKALYRGSADKLIIQATSTAGVGANLVADVPGLGSIALSWQSTKQWWQKTIWQAAANGLQVDSATIITVSGPEGLTTVNLTGDITAPPPPPPPQCTDVDGDGYFAEATCGTVVDCNDTDATVHPGATEVENDGIDQDCNGQDLVTTPPPPQCTDADGDGYFVEATCGTAVDCNDTDATVHPGAIEVENDGIDQDCNGTDLTTTAAITGTALYRTGGDKLIIQATSSVGIDANLMADLPGLGTVALSWQPTYQRWQKTIWQASTQGLVVDSATIITVHGAGSTTSVNLTIK